MNEIKRFSSPRKGKSAEALLVLGEKAETTQTIRLVPTPLDYWIATTYARERAYRTYFLELEANRKRPLIERYRDLAKLYPNGLADVEPLPEEAMGTVQQTAAKRRAPNLAALGV